MSMANEQAAVLYRLALQDRLAFHTLSANRDIELRIVCFHGQQAVEKIIKTVLVVRELVFPPTHDLIKLAALLPQHLQAAFPASQDQLSRLNPYAVAFRYDDREIHLLTLEEARDVVDQIFAWAEELLGER